MQIGLVGMPGSGKTTLFNLLSGNYQPTGYSGSREVLTGYAAVPDPRIDFLNALYKPQKTTLARIEFKDIPGVKMDDSKARASHFLSEVRSADALVQVLKVFNTGSSADFAGETDPYRDLTDFSAELLLADMDILEKRIERLENAPKIKLDDSVQISLLKRLLESLENEQPINSVNLAESEKKLLAGQSFLSEKPIFLAVNIDEDQMRNNVYPNREKILAYANSKGIPVIKICAQVEMEINRLQTEEQLEFMEDLNLKESGLGRLARMAYEKLNLISFFTVGEDEVRAWPVRKGVTAKQAASKIHSDLERGFIRAEMFHYDHLHTLGNQARVRENGHYRLEGKDYPVQDGDIINFRFNV